MQLMRSLLNWLSRKRFPYEPLITVKVSRGHILHNLREFRKNAPQEQVAPVLKSNAYGHGLIEVARILEHEPGIPFFVVDSYFEAVALRAKGIKTPLLVIGYTRPRTIAESSLKNVSFTITDMQTLRAIKDAEARMRIHVKVDTGMHRQGILPEEIAEAIEIVKASDGIFLEGICTHLCDADNEDESYTEAQLVAWNAAVKQWKTLCPKLRYIHGCNTDGSRFAGDTHDNVIRLGIGLYGLAETAALTKQLDLKPVLEMSTIITSVRRIKKGDTVGYSRTFTAPTDMTLATVPVGYFEGIDRRLSNNGSFQVQTSLSAAPVACPIIGRVSMNITSIDVSGVPDVAVGTPVTVISRDASAPNSVREFARRCGTIDYETAVRIPLHLKRVVID